MVQMRWLEDHTYTQMHALGLCASLRLATYGDADHAKRAIDY